MNRLAAALLLGGVVLLATWVVAPAAPVSPAPQAGTPAPIEQAAPIVAEVNAQVDRLRERLASPQKFPPPVRDPFRFGERAEPRRPAAPAVEVTEPAEPPPPPLPVLVAILANTVDGVVVRTAVLSEGDDVQIRKTGDKIGQFVIGSITADALELVDPATSRTHRLSVK